jgi:hypothetical protein
MPAPELRKTLSLVEDIFHEFGPPLPFPCAAQR